MNPTEFATKIRTKYPGVYDNIPDNELTNKVIAKYPVYKSQVNLSEEAVKKPGVVTELVKGERRVFCQQEFRCLKWVMQ